MRDMGSDTDYGRITTSQYDVMNCPSVTTHEGGTTSTPHTFDDSDRLARVVDTVSGMTTWDYNGLDLLLSETTLQGSVVYTHNNAFRRATMTVAGQPHIVYGFDNADRLLTITQGSSQVTIGYDTASHRTSGTYLNGNSLGYSNNDANDLTSLTHKQGATVLGDLTYVYDAAGRWTTIDGTFVQATFPPTLSLASAKWVRLWVRTIRLSSTSSPMGISRRTKQDMAPNRKVLAYLLEPYCGVAGEPVGGPENMPGSTSVPALVNGNRPSVLCSTPLMS